ncbi:hypothetical protein [Xanthomonas arboricola]|uniref:hypothetical protein n=1 Tax=Xanthomonas arboricola TaxID=56448 RepID=UPI00069E6732|nr:hypothetical protein [Xanthomonas arboricola]KOB43474.1 hypothetical protein AE931_13000 [Xanthomonas arboricola]
MSLADLRFDHPRIFWCGAVALSATLVLGTFLALPDNGFFQATGISGAQRRILALKNAGYWYSRSLTHASAQGLQFDTRFGNVLRYQDGRLFASLPSGDRFTEVKLQFADVVVTSPGIAHRVVHELRFKDARLEIYDKDKSVVWVGGKPLNITLIEVGAAQPDPNPPTNIVDLAFASYYWNQAKGEHQ